MGSFWQQIQPTVVTACTTLIPLAATAIAVWIRAKLQATVVDHAVQTAPDAATQRVAAAQAVADMHPLLRPSAGRTETLVVAARAKNTEPTSG